MMFSHCEFYGTPENRMVGVHLYGLRHEIYNAFETSLKMSYKDIMCWLNQHDYGDDVTMLRDACEHLVASGVYYGSLACYDSLGAMLLRYYTTEQLAQMWAPYGVVEVRRNPYSIAPYGAGLWLKVVELPQSWTEGMSEYLHLQRFILAEKRKEGVEDDGLPF